MAIENCEFEGKSPHEEVLVLFRHHWIFIFRHLVFFIFFVGFYLYLIFHFRTISRFLDPIDLHLALTLFLTFYLHYFFYHLIHYFENIFIITNVRVVEIDGENVDSLNLHVVPDVQKEQTWLLRVILNFGNLNFSDMKTIKCIPDPNHYYDLINEVRSKFVPPMPMQNPEGTGQPDPIVFEEMESSSETIPENLQENSRKIPIDLDDTKFFPETHSSTLSLNPPPKENEQVDKAGLPAAKKKRK